MYIYTYATFYNRRKAHSEQIIILSFIQNVKTFIQDSLVHNTRISNSFAKLPCGSSKSNINYIIIQTTLHFHNNIVNTTNHFRIYKPKFR